MIIRSHNRKSFVVMCSLQGDAIVLANSEFIRRHLGLYSAEPLRSPLSPAHYRHLRELQSSARPLVKRNVVLVDNDHLQTPLVDVRDVPWDELTLRSASSDGYLEEVRVVSGLDHEALVAQLETAKVVIDLYVPGAERLVQEAALLYAVPVLS